MSGTALLLDALRLAGIAHTHTPGGCDFDPEVQLDGTRFHVQVSTYFPESPYLFWEVRGDTFYETPCPDLAAVLAAIEEKTR